MGDRIRELRLSEIKFTFMPLEHKDDLFYVVFIVDMKDNPVATQRTFMDFYHRHFEAFDEILTGTSVPTNTVERLRNSMAQFLVPLARDNKFFSARDKTHLASSYVVSLLISTLFTISLWGVNVQFDLMEESPIVLAELVFVLLFLLPGIPIGILTQYGRHAIIVAFLNSLTVVVGATVLWQDLLLRSAHQFIGSIVVREIVILSATLVGIMLGTTLALVSYLLAKFFERRRLTCIKRLKHIPAIVKTEPPDFDKPPKAPPIEEMGDNEG